MLKFDWHNEPEGFFKWLLPHILVSKNHDLIDELSDKTDKFTDVQLTIQVNGVELDAQHFMDAFLAWTESGIKNFAKEMVQEPLSELVPDLQQLQETVQNAERAIRNEIQKKLKAAGIEINLDEEYW